MALFISLILILALPAAIIAAIMYFKALSDFGRVLESEQPDVVRVAREASFLPLSKSKVAYKVLSRAKNGAYQGVVLSPNALAALSTAKRILYVYLALFLTLIAGFLSYGPLVGNGPQA